MQPPNKTYNEVIAVANISDKSRDELIRSMAQSVKNDARAIEYRDEVQ
ncbi:MAG TPA: hypothetical protein VMW24_15545 [Sedimentisphaerales bacterium]|nr:hypothetical protein [Sedimentisphaerales bacterium]